METSEIWMEYIWHSPEQPLGKVTKFFLRVEFQEEKGNYPHFHNMMWAEDDLATEEGINAVVDRIRGYTEDILHPDEIDQYIGDGVFSNYDAALSFLDMIATVLPHLHMTRCFITTQNEETGDSQTKPKCKVPNNYKLNPSPSEHSFINLPIQHSQEAMHIMQEIGAAKPPTQQPTTSNSRNKTFPKNYSTKFTGNKACSTRTWQ